MAWREPVFILTGVYSEMSGSGGDCPSYLVGFVKNFTDGAKIIPTVPITVDQIEPANWL